MRCPDWYCDWPTPTSIYQDEEERDVFWEILEYAGFTAEDFIIDLDNAMWDRFRYHMINGCSEEYWVQAMKDKARSLYRRYFAYLTKYAEVDQTDLADGVTTMHTDNENELMPDTPIAEGDKYLSSRSNTDQTITTHGGLAVDAYGHVVANFIDPYSLFAKEFDGLFLNRW
jgi:hypothetical protein